MVMAAQEFLRQLLVRLSQERVVGAAAHKGTQAKV